MLGAIIGDIVGSVYESDNTKDYNFHLLTPRSKFTDDTVMTLAVAKWLTEDDSHSHEYLVKCMRELGLKYPGRIWRQFQTVAHRTGTEAVQQLGQRQRHAGQPCGVLCA